MLCALGQTVIISNCEDHQKLIKYLENYKIQTLGLVIGARELLEVISDKYYNNIKGNLLSAFGDLFTSNVKMYVYPAMQEGSAELMNTSTLPLPDEIKFIYQHLLDNQQIVDIEGFNKKYLHIYSKSVLEMIRNDEKGWEKLVPRKIVDLIKDKCLFDYPYEQLEFDY